MPITSLKKIAYKNIKILDLTKEQRPRERLLKKGVEALSNIELLSILIRSGTHNVSAMELSKKLLYDHENNWSNLSKVSIESLMHYSGIGLAKAAIIASAIEIGRRMSIPQKPSGLFIKSAQSVYNIIRPIFLNKIVEEFWVMLIKQNSQLIKNDQISKGGLTSTSVDPKVIFKVAIEARAPSIILIHNHPSGSTKPSQEDKDLTNKLLKAGSFLDIRILDHIIVSDYSFFSFLENGLI